VHHEVQGPDNFADRTAQGSSLTTDHSFAGNWLRVASPSTVNDVRVQAAARTMSLRPNAFGAMLEIPGVTTLGEFYRMNADRSERHYQVVENLNVTARGHRVSLGADAHAVRFDGILKNRFGGIWIFPTLDDFVAARPDVFIQAFGSAQTSMNTVPVGLWIQDRWEPRTGLHLELGARFDRQRMPAGFPASSNNVAPRAGVAWRPTKNRPLVLRAGFGLFYDRYALAYLNDAAQKNGRQAFEQHAAGEAAAQAFSRARGGTLPAPLAGAERYTYQASRDFPSSYGRKFSAGIEQGLGKDTSLFFEASHIRGFHLARVRRDAGGAIPAFLLEQTAKSEYLGASVSLNRRLSKELGYLVTYSAGRTRDDASDFDEHPMDPLDLRKEWAPSRQHQGHRLAMSALFDMPEPELAQALHWLTAALEDITVAPIFTLGSGRPINALLTTDVNRTDAYPLSVRPPGFGRNSFQARGFMSLDLRVMKTFRVLHDRALLQFGVESFNLTNHTNADRISQFYASPAGRLSSYGATLESLPARQVQFLVQLEY